jgi:CRISPR/Cas system CSM-associated protein Csm3 (group 7 of RAMP superfamily)
MSFNIKTKFIIQATLLSKSPLLIGSGRDEKADAEVMLRNGNPYIPASSFVGSIKKYFNKYFEINDQEALQLNYFWGSSDTSNDNSTQSHFIVEDLLVQENDNVSIEIRDGVKINHETGTAEDGAKYDYQCVAEGVKFIFKATLSLRDNFDKDVFLRIINSIQHILKTDFRIGAFTNTGLGKMDLTDFTVYQFDFPNDVASWFHYLQKSQLPDPLILNNNPFKLRQCHDFKLQATFKLKTPLMVGAYGIEPEEADKRHLHSKGKPVLPAKSIKGAIRHRANRIANTLNLIDKDTFINDLFGFVNTSPSTTRAKPSRLKIDEVILEGLETHLQDRIKIDRFTGGTMDGALFNSEPLVGKSEYHFTIQFSIENFKDEEAAVLLLLLKDLWTEDLPIGGEKNIGRGILSGQSAEIIIAGEQTISLRKNEKSLGLSTDQREKLEGYVQKLLTKQQVSA